MGLESTDSGLFAFSLHIGYCGQVWNSEPKRQRLLNCS
jgi:hypothetical protein